MNFLQKYDLRPITRYGKSFVAVEDIGHVIHELEQTIQFLKLENNRLNYAIDACREYLDKREAGLKDTIAYYRESRDKAWNEISETRCKQLTYKRKYHQALLTILALTGYCVFLLVEIVGH
jgi:hypothetical protein